MKQPTASAPIEGPVRDTGGGPQCHCRALREAARRATALYDGAMAPFGLRISQFSILVRLRRAGPIGLHELADALRLDRTTLGRNLAPLERDGLVSSAGDARDRRVRLLAVTPAGLAMLQRAMPAWQAAQAAYEARVGQAEAVRLRTELADVARRLDEDPGAAPG